VKALRLHMPWRRGVGTHTHTSAGALLAAVVVAVVNDGAVEAQGEPAQGAQATKVA
jgi:hypothetical protein